MRSREPSGNDDVKGIVKTGDSGVAARNREKTDERLDAGVRPAQSRPAAPRRSVGSNVPQAPQRGSVAPAESSGDKPVGKDGPLESLGKAISAPVRDAAAKDGATPSGQTDRRSREDRIREAAYRRFQARGGSHGEQDRDWFEAEAELDKDTDEGGRS